MNFSTLGSCPVIFVSETIKFLLERDDFMDQIQIGRFIASCRKEKNLTQEQLAEKLGVTSKSISRWENGRNMPDLSLFHPLCDELDITINDLIQGKKLSVEEQKKYSDQNAFSVLMTKKELENMQLLTEILIVAGIVITMTLTKVLAVTALQKIVTLGLGTFIWGFGIFLRVKLRKAHERLKTEEETGLF